MADHKGVAATGADAFGGFDELLHNQAHRIADQIDALAVRNASSNSDRAA